MTKTYKDFENVMPKEIFKAYDIRGKYPKQINEVAVYTIARSLGDYFKSRTRSKKSTAVVAYDVRLSSPSLYRAAILGLEDVGRTKIVKAGLTTTPMFYFLVKHLRADYGVIITASHNPKEWNGLKVVGKNAEMIGGDKVLRIVQKWL
ncbi:MAG: hypothetical protein KJI72_02260 [Patescibacteria group bacterium]|nr:hypothetical protein [Patescibacteria group bacterium]